MAAKINITRFKGDTYQVILHIKNPDRTPFDLTGRSFTLSVIAGKDKGTTSYLLQSTGTSIGDPAEGVLGFPLTPEQVAHVGSYDYDVEMTDTDGTVKTIAHGAWLFIQDVTQSPLGL
jgi:hypothetical protein